MNKNTTSGAKFVTIFGSVAMLFALLTVGGCGDDSTPATQSNSTRLTSANATLNTTGTVTTTSQVTATTAGGATAITIPAGTTITGASAYTSLPEIVVSTPTSGVSGMPQPITPDLTITSTAGAISIHIGGQEAAYFSKPVTLTIPNDPANTDASVDINKEDGTGWHHLGPGTMSSDNKSVAIPVNDLCWFGVRNIYKTRTGAIGGHGTGGF
jgi:hypothetical protein